METNKGAETIEVGDSLDVNNLSIHGVEMEAIVEEKFTYGFKLKRRDGTLHVMGGFHTEGSARRSAATYNMPWRIVRKKIVTMVSEWSYVDDGQLGEKTKAAVKEWTGER